MVNDLCKVLCKFMLFLLAIIKDTKQQKNGNPLPIGVLCCSTQDGNRTHTPLRTGF